MKRKIRVISLILAMTMVFAMLGACTEQTDETTAAPAETTAAPAETTTAPADDDDSDETTAPPAASDDWKSFRIDPAQIPQEKLDTTLYVGASIRGLDNPYIVTIIEGMKMLDRKSVV